MNFEVGIIGLGYVGLTLAAALAKSGVKVVGIERNEEIVTKVNSGKAHFTEVGLAPIIKDQIKIYLYKVIVNLREILSILNFKDNSLLCTILFKEEPSQKTIKKLKNLKWDIKKLPKNPYI